MIFRLGWFELIRLHVLITTTGVDVHVVPTISSFQFSGFIKITSDPSSARASALASAFACWMFSPSSFSTVHQVSSNVS